MRLHYYIFVMLIYPRVGCCALRAGVQTSTQMVICSVEDAVWAR